VEKAEKNYFDSKKFIAILALSTLCVLINISLNNSLSENHSTSNPYLVNANGQQQQTVNQSFINTNLEKLKNNFFYVKTNYLLVPVNFVTQEDNILNNIIYDDDQNALFILMNPLPSNKTDLLVQIPRYILDSKTPENKDNNFTVLIDGKPSKYTEITSRNESGSISSSISGPNIRSNSSPEEASADHSPIDITFNDIPNRKLLIDFQKDTKVIKIAGTDLSKTQSQSQNQSQNQNVYFSIITLIISAIIGISLATIIYILYKKGKIRFGEIFKFKSNKQGENK
jgi:hypothetical protein